METSPMTDAKGGWNYAGKTVVITGGSGALGQAMVSAFSANDANVVSVTRRPRTEIVSRGAGEIVQISADITDRAAVETMAARAVERFGRIDVLINNAGGQVRPTRFVDMVDDMFDWEIDINIYGVLYCSQVIAKSMIHQRRGNIINISSNAALKGSAGQYAACYAGCKGFVISLSKTLAYDLAEYGIRVNTIAPGWIVPESTDNLSEDSFWFRFANDMFGKPDKFEADFKRTGEIHSVPDQPLKRLGRPADIAAAALYLASDAAAHTTGQLLSIGGGDYMPS
jgi:2-hydroxycyclohexanecarboxyl-CoA dehydrogenase